MADAEDREERRSSAGNDADALLKELIKVEALLKETQQAGAELRVENETLKANVVALSTTAFTVPSLLKEASVDRAPIQAVEPDTVAKALIQAQAETTNLVYLQSAMDSAQTSPYRQPVRVLEALQAIDEVAAKWLDALQSGKSHGPLKKLFKEYGFDYADKVSQTSRGKWGGKNIRPATTAQVLIFHPTSL
ncbi:hypothetical protein [Variovorax paradoxus]|uniref:hypothetical protein n=1 Tax=Variovorax paradoxus TaxID=34073 RepID=UPI0012BB74AE|nr:hypothetical protein [Variovorax paradoxus]